MRFKHMIANYSNKINYVRNSILSHEEYEDGVISAFLLHDLKGHLGDTVAVSRLWTRFSARAAGRSRCASGLCPKLSFFAQDSVCRACRDKEAALSRETRLAKQIEQLEST